MTLSLLRSLVPVLALSLLPGCAAITQLNTVATASDLFTLTPKSTFSANLPTLSEQLVVETPTATAAISGDQIAVQPTPLQVQYLPGVRWVDRAPLIVQTLLIESFENTDRVPAVGASGVGLRADYYVVPDLREFQGQVPSRAAPEAPLQVLVRLNIKIVDAVDQRIIASKSFNELTFSATDAPEEVVAAFDEALGRVLRDSIEWSIRRISAHSAERDRVLESLRPRPVPRPDQVEDAETAPVEE